MESGECVPCMRVRTMSKGYPESRLKAEGAEGLP